MRLIVLAGVLSLAISLLGTPLLIKFLRRRNYSQAIRESRPDELYPEHTGKKGTPSMGGLAIIVAVVGAYSLTHLIVWQAPTTSGLLAMLLFVGLGAVGYADDYLKIFKKRATGIRARTKLLGQAAVAVAFAVLAAQFPDPSGQTPASQAISIVRDTAIVLPLIVFLVWILFLVLGTTNAVNLTDGLDGLASGAAGIAFISYILVTLWQFRQMTRFDELDGYYTVRDPLDLAVFAAACAGACFGFLWHNTSPARIFMGDTGSLALGGALAALAIMSRTQLLLVLFGGLFVIITLSVIGQVGSYKLLGRRMFRMAPLHHHFELLGWPEVTIVVRFWIIQGSCVLLGLAFFYADWIGRG